jgi:catechol 2,3-dioxygenase-like lactoylglutathione lyase family enzyme
MSGNGLGRRHVLAAGMITAAASLLAGCGTGHDAPQPNSSSSVGGGGAGHGAVGLGIVGILTDDIDRSLRFYRRLGLDVPESAAGNSYRMRSPDGYVLFWENAAEIHSFDPTWTLPSPAQRRIVLEFGFARPGDLDDTYRSLTTAGAPSHLAPFDQGGGVRYAIVLDPDGNQISLRYPAK